MAKLVCQSGPNAGHEHPLTKDRSVFGRQGDCDGQIPDAKASREHFAIQRFDKIFSLMDLKSRNGTRLNGSKISERILEFGDCIRVGQCEYIFTQESGDMGLSDMLTKYDLEGRIGQGGMGIVYKARQRSMDRTVALKILAPKFNSKSNFIDQFIREARAAGALNHPNIIQVHDVGTENGVHYFSMEFVDGPTCLHVLRNQGKLSPGQALEIVRQTAKALDYAHEHKLIHRDIKPDNIMLANGDTVKLADLGISKTFDEIEQDNSKKIVGTPHYIAPEAAKGNKIDHRVDIYSLGATTYHILTGKTPYQGNAPTDILKQLLKDEPTPIRELEPEIPDSVAELVEKMMAKDPDERIGNAMDLMKEIETIQSSGDVESKKPGDGETIILRRLAAGGTPEDVGGGAETAYTTNHTSGDVSQHSHTTLAAGSRFNPVQLILVLIIVAALGVIGYTLVNQQKGDETDTSTGSGDTSTAGMDQNDPNGSTDTQDDSTNNNTPDGEDILKAKERERALLRQLDDLNKQITAAKDSKTLSVLNDSVQAIGNQKDLPRNAAIRVKNMLQQIDNRQQDFKSKAANDALKKLGDDVRGLIDRHEYKTALQRIAAIERQHGRSIKPRTDSLKRDVEQQESIFISRLNRRIKEAVRSGDRDELKKIRDSLPPAFVDSDIAKSINKSMRDLDKKEAASRNSVVIEAEKYFANWSLTSARNYYDETEHLLKGSQAAHKKYQELNAHVGTLLDLVKKIDSGLKPRETYRGKLRHLTNPYVNGADETSLFVLMDNGGQVKVPWKTLDRESINKIISLARLKPDDYQAALDAQKAAADKHSSE